MKKCCVNCAFCARYVNDSANALTAEEHKCALSGDFNFIGKEQRAQKEWQKQYKQIYEDLSRGKYHNQLGGPRVLEILATAHNPKNFPAMGSPDPIVDLFGLPPYPLAPYNDFLACWQEQWHLQGKEHEFQNLNQKNACLFFYPYNKKGNKSFEGCEKEREALLAKSRFMTTNWLVILGIFVTILIFAIQTWSNRQSNPQQEIVTVEEKTHQTLTPTTQSENSQPSESEKK